MKDASDTKPYELGPLTRAEIAEEALRTILNEEAGCGCEVCVREVANTALARISGVN